MSKKLQGFTIAELLISLLIISLVLSAAIPTITRKTAGNESIWQWSESANSAFFGVGEQQAAIVGNTYKPDGGVLTNSDTDTQGLLDDNKFVNSGDKLVIVKKAPGLSSSHISFYNVEGTTTTSISYAGRLALDKFNVALGLGALGNSQSTCSGEGCTVSMGNTAIGHYTLVANETGLNNTAIGTKALAKNTASSNTAVGSMSSMNTAGTYAVANTSVGAESLKANAYADGNTAVGYKALANVEGSSSAASLADALLNGGGNTAVGSNACEASLGSRNLCLGYYSGNSVMTSSNGADTFATRYNVNTNTNGFLYIGSDHVPLIAGRMFAYDTSADANTKKMVALNAQDVDINTPNSEYRTLNINSVATDAYGHSIISYIPHQTATKTTLITMATEDAENEILSINNEVYNGTEVNKYGQIWLNKGALKISIGKDGDGNENVAINPDTTNNTYNTMLLDYGRLTMNKEGKTVLSNGNGTTGLGTAFINLNTDNTIDLGNSMILKRTSGEDVNNEITFNGTNITFKSLDDTSKLNLQLQTDFNKNVKFTSTSYVTSINDIMIDGLQSLSGGGFTNSAPNDGVKAGIAALWTAVSDLRNLIGWGSSDERLKNISGDSKAGLKEINALQVKNFTYKNDKEKTPHVGVIAQQLQKIFPNSVRKDKDGYLEIRKEEIFYAMVNSIKELYAQLQSLTAKITGLDNRIKKLEEENAQLKKQNAEFEKRLKRLEEKS